MQKIYRILDANINRALEGLRVVEEIARFVLADKHLSVKLKNLRAQVKNASAQIPHNQMLIKVRDSSQDVGWKVYPQSEAQRANLMSIFKANIKRAAEALRVLEEFSKMLDVRVRPGAVETRRFEKIKSLSHKPLGRQFKDLRFLVYDLEKAMYLAISVYEKKIKLAFDWYVILDPRAHGRSNLLKVATQVLKAGVTFIQYRDKVASRHTYLKTARQIKKITDRFGAVLLLNDYADLVPVVGADGVHLGQTDLALSHARKLLGEEKIIGVSTHSFRQALRADKSPADYLACGPIFKTKTKPWRRAVGLSLLRRVVKTVKKPVVAIGGINRANLNAVKKTGAKRVAVINAAEEIF